MTAVLKALDWLNGQLYNVMQLDSREALCMDYHVCTSMCLYGAPTRHVFKIASLADTWMPSSNL